MAGSLNASVNLGMYAEASYSKQTTKNLITVPIPVSLHAQHPFPKHALTLTLFLFRVLVSPSPTC